MKRAWVTSVLVLAFASGCAASPASPRSLDDARALLARPATSELRRARPKMVAEAEEQIELASSAAQKGDAERANLHATIATAKYKTAQNFVARDELAARRRAEAASEAGPARQKLEEVDAKIAKAGASLPATKGVEAARAAVAQARNKQAEAIREGAATRAAARFEEGRVLLDLAIDDLAAGGEKDARARAERAVVAFDLALAEAKGNAAHELPAPRQEPEPRAPKVAAAPPVHADSVVRTRADAKILELELRRAELLGQGRDEACKAGFRELDATLDIARARLQAGDAVAALEVVTRAGERLRACDAPQAGVRAAASPATGSGTASPTAPKPTAPVDGAGAKAASQALQRAHDARIKAEAAAPEDKRLERAASALAKAEQWFDRAGYEQAEVYARQAETEFAAIAREKPKTPSEAPKVDAKKQQEPKDAPKDPKEPKDAPKDPKEPKDAPKDPKEPPKDRATKAEPEPSREDRPSPAAPPSTVVPAGAPWGAAYARIEEALGLRGQALAVAGEPDKSVLATAEDSVGRARGAWKVRDYGGAEAYAGSAANGFRAVLAAAKKRSLEANQAAAAATTKDADEALREARFALDDCAREACDDRDAAALARGKRLLETAEQARATRDLPYALDLARQALARFRDALAAPRKSTPADPKAAERARLAAEDAIREASVQSELCASNGCERYAAEEALRAKKDLEGARDLMSRQGFEAAKELAARATAGFTAAIAKLPKLVIPAGVTHVSVDGKRLVTSPAPEFANGTAKLTPASAAIAKEVAQVLRANKELVSRVNITGHTDAQGNPTQNTALSQARAQAIAAVLASEGIAAALVKVEGKGSRVPVADNATEEGRKANRRVEIDVELK